MADTTVRDKRDFNDVEYFIQRFPKMLPLECTPEILEREFVNYQEINHNEVPSYIFQDAIPDFVVKKMLPKKKK